MRVVLTLLVATLLLPACAQRRSEPQSTPSAPPPVAAAPTPTPTPTPAPAPAPAPTPAPTPTLALAMSSASTPDAYKIEMAQRIYAASTDISSGRPQDLLRAVIVLNVIINSNGQPGRISIQRSPGDAEAEQRAIQSVQRGAPYARPSSALLRGAAAFEISETWLFNDDGRFQLRSVAPTQAGG